MQVRKIFLPSLRSISAICLAVFGFSRDGVDFAPSSASCLVEFLLFLLGQLLVRNESLHTLYSFQCSKSNGGPGRT